jgi:hypothetical protein
MSVIPWVWRCTGCDQLVPHSAVEPRCGDGESEGEAQWWHFDALRRAWCGLCVKDEVR